MQNAAFYDAIFPHFWETIDTSRVLTDEHSMFGDEPVFKWLIETTRPSELIEVGSWKGHSANYMADVCKSVGLKSRIVCVDTFLGGPEHWLLPGAIETLHRSNGRPTILERFLGNVFSRQNTDCIFPLTADSVAGSEILRHHGFKADLIFIDGAHYPSAVRSDITKFYPLLSERGVMFGDDYQHEPLAKTVHECAKELSVQVLVSGRKWIFGNEALMKRIALPNVQMRQSFDGWVHP